MKWNHKGILLCIIVFLGLFGFLIGRAVMPPQQEQQDTSFASEEDVVFPSVPSGAALGENNVEISPTPGNDRKKKESVVKTTATAWTTDSAVLEKQKAKATPKTMRKKKIPVKDEETEKPTSAPTAVVTAVPTATMQEQALVFLTIQCTAILEHKELWKEGIEEIVPSSGYFYQGQQEISEGETVYDILKRICKEKNIALDAEYTPLYGTYYIKGIGNLYEFDCGGESGWKYKVNGILPGVGCSNYSVKKGDEIVIFYDYQY